MRFVSSLGGYWWLLPLLCCFSGLLRAETRHIHVLKILDDENQEYTIREGCRSISYGIDQEIALMKDRLGILSVIEYNLSGANCPRERLNEVIEYEMEYLEEDIVVVVYVGHGFRPHGHQGSFPYLYFNAYSDAVDYGEVQQMILDRNPSMLISMIIACNVTQQDPSLPPPVLEDNAPPSVVSLKGVARPRRDEPYYQLFAQQEGVTKCVDFISADQEYYTFLSRDGGIFFSEILYTFQEVFTDLSFRDWDSICTTIADRTVARSQVRGLLQQPLCRYYVRLAPILVQARDYESRSRNYCKRQLRDVRQLQRQELRDLRRRHRQQTKMLYQQGVPTDERRLRAREQRVELNQWKLRHEQIYQRQLQQCLQ